ncbi:MAG: VPDSG-CTERM sorting domain-containing protein [Lacunisphaera sp.]
MKKLLATAALLLISVPLLRADFTSYTLVSQSTALTYDPVVSHTFDSLSINFTGNSGGGENFTTDLSTGAVVSLSFTSDVSIAGDSVQLAWIYPTEGSVYEYFPSIVVPGTVFLGSGASNFVVTGNTITITNTTEGWTGAQFNGFVLTDLTRKAAGPSGGGSNVPDSGSSLALLGFAFTGLGFVRRFVRR